MLLASLHILTDKKFRNIIVLGCNNVVDPGHFGTEPDPALFVRDLQDAKKNQNFLAFYFLKVHLHYFLKIKLSSRCHKTEVKVFLTIFA